MTWTDESHQPQYSTRCTLTYLLDGAIYTYFMRVEGEEWLFSRHCVVGIISRRAGRGSGNGN